MMISSDQQRCSPFQGDPELMLCQDRAHSYTKPTGRRRRIQMIAAQGSRSHAVWFTPPGAAVVPQKAENGASAHTGPWKVLTPVVPEKSSYAEIVDIFRIRVLR